MSNACSFSLHIFSRCSFFFYLFAFFCSNCILVTCTVSCKYPSKSKNVKKPENFLRNRSQIERSQKNEKNYPLLTIVQQNME